MRRGTSGNGADSTASGAGAGYLAAMRLALAEAARATAADDTHGGAAVAGDVPQRPSRPCLRVGGTVDDAADPGRDHGPGAHGARFQGDDQRAPLQPP